ncbi:P-loop containing nucleoside triphosphate hydrolase protein [Gorgonomyces haynaldii]|nr:P-loop containing nucleoside triphosphate hydrolase protein [Gorgonomyces haynaldii]
MSIASGSALPLTTIVFGALVNSFSKWQMQPRPGVLITADELMSEIVTNTLYFVYLAIASFVTTYIYMAIFVWTSEASAHRIRQNYLRAVLRQNVGWFDQVGAGEVSTCITTNTLLIQDALGEKIPLAVNHISTFIASFVIAFTKSWRLTLILLTVIPLIAITAAVMGVLSGRFQTAILAKYSKAGTAAEESISAVRTVAAFNAQKKMSVRYNNALAAARDIGIKKAVAVGLGLGTLFGVIYCAYALAFYYGYLLLTWNLIDSGTIVNVFFAVLIGAFSLGNISPDLQAFDSGRAAAITVFATIDRVPTIDPYDEGGEKIPQDKFKGKISIKDVEFTYPARPGVRVLNKVSFEIEAGHSVALVGQSGSGKSTIIQLIERFYDCDAGSVEIDGIPVNKLNLHWLRQQIGLVSQEPTLFEGTVLENVAQGLAGTEWEHASKEKQMELIQDACKQANAHDFIMKLSDGYNSQVGERGMLLSGGQKQRVAIARAIVKNPKILLLDEATSALDTTSERVVQKALDNVSQSRTTVTIAHRLSTIKNSNNIIVMVKGDIVEQGNHENLIAQNGLYSRLVDAQKVEQGKKKPEEEQDPDAIIVPRASHAKSAKSTTQAHESAEKVDIETGGQEKYNIFYEIYKLNLPELKYTIPALIAALAAGMINPIFSIVLATIIDVFTKTGSELENGAKQWSLNFVFLAIYAWVFNFGQNALFGFASEYLTERIRKNVFEKILYQDISFFDDNKNSTGVLTSNLSQDATKVQGVSGATLGTLLQLAATIVGGIIISLVYGWKLALVTIAALPLAVFTGYSRYRIITYFSDMTKEAYERSAQVATEAVSGIKTVQSLTREKAVIAYYDSLLEEPLQNGFKSAYQNTVFYALSSCTNFLVNALTFWYGGTLIINEGYSLQNFFTIFAAIVFGSQSLGRVFAAAPDVSKAYEAGENIMRITKAKPLINTESEEGKKLEKIDGYVEFQNVKFRYPTRPEILVLKGLDLKIKPGQFAALVGASGCGKSTTIGLIERFYDVTGGKLLIDGQDIRSLHLRTYRNLIGLVSQEPNLFDMSIKENVAFGCETMPSQEEIEAACKQANAHDFIMQLPQGYDTNTGSRGGQLSGGQKQRIAIARALVRKPKILLLDEATSALDAESEKVVQEALDKATKGRTTIAIAHRLSSVQHADVIYVFRDGLVAEQGTHQELFDRKGLYYELAVAQNLKA